MEYGMTMSSSRSGNSMTIDASPLRPAASRRRGIITTQPQQQQRYMRDLYEFRVERNQGLPVSLSCLRATDSRNDDTATTTTGTTGNTTTTNSSSSSNHSNNNTTTNSNNDTRLLLNTTISFDYELVLRDPVEESLGEVLRQDLPQWEFFLLYYVAHDIGIVGCQDIGQQNISTTGSSSSSNNNKNASYSVDVVSLSSFGSDVIDSRVASCEFLVNLEPGFICLPLQGIMTADFVGYESDRPAVEAFLAHHVATVVNDSDFFGAGVNETSFIGSRVIATPPPPIVDDDSSKSLDDEDSSMIDVPVTVASTLAVAAVIAAFFLYLVVARRRRARPQQETRDDVMSKQVPTGGADDDLSMLTTTPPTNQNAPSSNPTPRSIGSGSDQTDDARCGSLESTNRFGREVIAPPSIQTAYSLTNARTVSTVVSTDDSEVYIDDDETAKISNETTTTTPVVLMTDALPPKHPTGPSSKILLVPMVGAAKLPKSQRRRKKKKRKKTVATKIVRSNSRENISEMETITEGEEETSGDNNDLREDGSDDDDDDEDEGSWCSTSDSDPGSRDPSPARSSRDPSPARSTGSAGPPNDRTNSTGSSPVATTTTTTGPSPDRTTGTDQPKPKKKLSVVNI